MLNRLESARTLAKSAPQRINKIYKLQTRTFLVSGWSLPSLEKVEVS